jgi:cyclopropane fatty-acyl-phospholipid synthase-like methyltransferase
MEKKSGRTEKMGDSEQLVKKWEQGPDEWRERMHEAREHACHIFDCACVRHAWMKKYHNLIFDLLATMPIYYD